MKKNLKQIMASLLTLILVISSFGGGLTALAQISTTAINNDLAFYVPEAAYLYPNLNSAKSATATPIQYFIQNTVNTSSIYSTPTTNTSTDSSAKIYFATPKISGTPSLSYRMLKSDGTTVLTSSGLSVGALSSKSGYYEATVSPSGSTPSLASTETGFYIEWTVTYTDSETGKSLAAIAYTYVYKPNVVPAGGAIRTENTHSSAYLSSLAWLSGQHTVSAATEKENSWEGTYYPSLNSNGDNQFSFAPFLSDNTTGYVGNTKYDTNAGYNQRGTSITYTKSDSPRMMYQVYANTTAANSYFNAHQDISYNNKNCASWLVSSADDSYAPIKTFDYFSHSSGKQTIGCYMYCSAMSGITIDTSRYSNLSEIPNLGVGLLVTDDEDGNKGTWFVGDATGTSYTATESFKQDTKNDCTLGHQYWNDRNSIIAGESSNASEFKYHQNIDSYGDEEIKYAGAWNKAISSGTSTYSIKLAKEIWDSDWDTGHNIAIYLINLKTTQYNKANLRTAVDNAMANFANFGVTSGFGSIYYNTSNSAWTTFVNAYKAACLALTKIDGTITDPATLATNLNNAVTNLKNGAGRLTSTATANHYGVARLLDGTGAEAGYVVKTALASPAETKTFNYSDTLTIAKNAYTNYTYKGYSASSGTNGLNAEYSSATAMVENTAESTSGKGINMLTKADCNFYYLANDVTLTVNPNGGTWNKTKDSSTVTGTYTSVFTPDEPTRPCHEFAGWTITSGTGTISADGRTFTFGDSAATLTAQWTEISTEHEWEDKEVKQEPSCTVPGTMLQTCKKCGLTREVEIPVIEHTWGTITHVAKTEGGVDVHYHQKVCSVCNQLFEEKCEFDAAVTAPTCGVKGFTTYTCPVCGHSYTGDEVAATGNHTWDDGTVKREANCHEEGEMEFSCTVCGATKTEPIAVDSGKHDGETEIRNAKEATCTEDGYTGDTYCLGCGAKTADGKVITAKGHTEYISKEAKAPTCTEDGWTEEISCSVCHEVTKESEPLTALGHSYGDWDVTDEPQCEQAGSRQRICTVCGHVDIEAIPALGHDWSEIAVTKQPTCTEPGIREATCLRCGVHKDTVEIVAKGHTEFISKEAKEPTCTEDGWTAEISCSECGEIIETSKPLTATGHSFGEWYTVKPATCAEEGEMRRDCGKCEHYETDVIAKDRNNHVGGTYELGATEPTCSEPGYTGSIYCSGCNKFLGGGDLIDYLGKDAPLDAHKNIEIIPAVEPTCDKPGYTEGKKCADCGKIIEEPKEIPAKGHVDDDGDGVCDDCGGDATTTPGGSGGSGSGSGSGSGGSGSGSGSSSSYRCKMCDTYEAHKDIPVVGIFYTIIHFFVHLAHSISHMT